jgi:hypothetical protein
MPSFYFLYFAKLLSRRGVDLTGDLTPLYSGLGADRLHRIRQGFESRNIQCSVVFIMREPVERCASVVGMWRRRARDGQRPPDEKFLQFETYSTSPHAVAFTDYDWTLNQIEKAFSANDVYLGLYEDMFTEERIGSISSFLGVAPVLSMVKQKFNVSAKTGQLDEELFRDAARFHRDAYDAAAARMPIVRNLWKGFKYL